MDPLGREEHEIHMLYTCGAAIPFESGVLWLLYKIEDSKGPK
jgi:hypothetical protein